MAINAYLSTIESKKQTKQRRRTETESWIQKIFQWLRGRKEVVGNG